MALRSEGNGRGRRQYLARLVAVVQDSNGEVSGKCMAVQYSYRLGKEGREEFVTGNEIGLSIRWTFCCACLQHCRSLIKSGCECVNLKLLCVCVCRYMCAFVYVCAACVCICVCV